MNIKTIIAAFVKYRKRIDKWFEDGRETFDPGQGGVTWQHFEEGYKAGYEQRKKDELEEILDAL